MNDYLSEREIRVTSKIDGFPSWLEEKNRAENTILVYTYAVRQFYGLYDRPDPNSLQLYKCFLLEHYKPQTVNLRIRALNCYMEYRNMAASPVPMLLLVSSQFPEHLL